MPKVGPAIEKSQHIQAFETWFACEKDIAKTQRFLATSQPPVSVSLDTLYRWKAKYNWDARVRERDEAVAKERTEQAIREQAEFLKRKANYGKLMQKRGLEFFNTQLYKMDAQGNPILDKSGKAIPIAHVNNAAVAVQVMQAGVALEQSAIGLPEWITELMTADEQTLRRVYETAVAELARASNIDADEADKDSAFPAVEIKPLPQAGNS